MAAVKNLTLKDIPLTVIKKFVRVKVIIKDKGVNISSVFPSLFEEMLDRFLEDPDVKKYIK